MAVSYADDHVRVFKVDGHSVADLAGGPACDFTPDGTGIAVREADGAVVIHDLPSGAERQRLAWPWPPSNAMAFSPDGQKLAMWDIYSATVVLVGEVATGSVAPLQHPDRVFRVDWSPAGNVLAVADVEGVHLWDLTSQPARLDMVLAGQVNTIDVKFSHGGDLLAGTSWDGTTRLWDAVSGEQLVRVFRSGMLRFGPDDRTLAISSGDGRHTVAEITPARERRTFAAPPGEP